MRRNPDLLLSVLSITAALAAAAIIGFVGESTPLRSGFPGTLPITLTVLGGLIAVALLLAARMPEHRPHAAADTDPCDRFRWLPVSAVVSLTVVGFTLRIADVSRFGLANDEALFVFAASHPTLGETLRDCLTHFHPPTNFVLLHFMLKLSWAEWWIRLPSVLGGTAAIGCTYLLGRALFGRLAGVISAFLTTFSANLILLSQVCRNYSPSLPFYLLSLYYLARFLKERRNAQLFAFAAFEFLAVAWHYALLPPFLGANLVLFIALLRGDRPLRSALRAVIAQVPVGILYGAALFLHLPVTQSGQQSKVIAYMEEEFTLEWSNPLKQLFDLVKYLAADSPELISFVPALLLFSGMIVGCIVLWRRGYRVQVALCLSYLPFAYLLAFAVQLLPFGGTRHSFYAFPFVFAPAAGLASFWIAGMTRGSNAGEEAAGRKRGMWATVTVAAVLCIFLFSSLTLYANVVPYYARQSPDFQEREAYYKGKFYKVVELPTRKDDLELIRKELLRSTGRGDVIATSLPTLMILAAYLCEERPRISFEMERPAEFEWEGRRFVYVPATYFNFTPDKILIAATFIGRDWGLGEGDRLWIALAGWEVWPYSLPSWVNWAYPGLIVDNGAAEATRDALFAVDVGYAMQRAGGVLELHDPQGRQFIGR